MSTPVADPQILSPAKKIRYRVLTLLFFLSIIVYLDRVCISVMGKRIKDDLDLTNEQFGWVLGAFALSYALFEIPNAFRYTMTIRRLSVRKINMTFFLLRIY